MIRLLVTGGRKYADAETVARVLDHIHEDEGIAVLIHGGAEGADSLCDAWAESRGIERLGRPANWKRYGTPWAGLIRNRAMLKDKPDRCVAFPGNRGTADMVSVATAAGIPVQVVDILV